MITIKCFSRPQFARPGDAAVEARRIASIAAAHEGDSNTDAIANGAIRNQLVQAMAHWASIKDADLPTSDSVGRPVSQTYVGVDELVSSLRRLAALLAGFQSEFCFQSEARLRLGGRIRELERRISERPDDCSADRLRETSATRRHQLRIIEELGGIVEHGLLALEHAVAVLAALSAQLAMFAAHQDECSGGRADIAAEIREIDAVLLALDRDHAAREERLAKLWDAPARG